MPSVHRWVDVQIRSELDAGELLGALTSEGISGAWQENGMIHLYWPVDTWRPECLADVRAAMARVADRTAVPDVTVATLPDEDWNAAWARAVTPLRIGTRLIVRPSWAPVPLRPGDLELVIDPKQAFGSGHHATTQLMLEWLEEEVRPTDRMLDVGTGSGILAMAALRYGAMSATGVDDDPVAIDCAREAAVVNGFGPELTLRTGTLTDVSGCYDLVLANLDRRTLLHLAPAFPAVLPRTGRLLCTGVLQEDREAILQAFEAVGGRATEERARDGWLALAWRFEP